jgi:hypothetical protein
MEEVKPLPAPYRAFERAQALLYPGAVTLLAGGPGSMKTITSLNFVNQLRVPTMYISNDSTQFTIIDRVFSLLTGSESVSNKSILNNEPERAAKALKAWEKVQFDFDSKPSIEDMVVNCEAFYEIHGNYPKLMVLDILMNVDHEGVAEQNYWRLMPELKEMASDMKMALLGVHHTSESAKGEPCPPMSSIMGKANQLPELIITQAPIRKAEGKMSIAYAVVKNRNGPSSPDGKMYFELPVFPSRFKIEEAEDDEGLLFRNGIDTPEFRKIGVNGETEGAGVQGRA